MEEVNATIPRYEFSNDTWEQDIANASYGLGGVVPNRTLSTHWLVAMRFVCEVCISFPVAVAGILGNVVTIVVLFHYKSGMTTTIILRWLALNNSLSLTVSIFLRSLRYAGLSHYDKVFVNIFFWMFPTNYAIQLTGTWLIVLLTFDRYIAVCHPLQAGRLCSRAKTNEAVFVIFFSAYRIP